MSSTNGAKRPADAKPSTSNEALKKSKTSTATSVAGKSAVKPSDKSAVNDEVAVVDKPVAVDFSDESKRPVCSCTEFGEWSITVEYDHPAAFDPSDLHAMPVFCSACYGDNSDETAVPMDKAIQAAYFDTCAHEDWDEDENDEDMVVHKCGNCSLKAFQKVLVETQEECNLCGDQLDMDENEEPTCSYCNNNLFSVINDTSVSRMDDDTEKKTAALVKFVTKYLHTNNERETFSKKLSEEGFFTGRDSSDSDNEDTFSPSHKPKQTDITDLEEEDDDFDDVEVFDDEEAKDDKK
jgi:hypothetical protein